MFFFSSHSHPSNTRCTHIKLFKAAFRFCDLPFRAHLPSLNRSRFFHLWSDPYLNPTFADRSTPPHTWTLYVSLQWVSLVHETRLFSPISSVHALFPSETIFLHHSYFAITKVKLWDLELCLYPVFSVYLFNFHSVL